MRAIANHRLAVTVVATAALAPVLGMPYASWLGWVAAAVGLAAAAWTAGARWQARDVDRTARTVVGRRLDRARDLDQLLVFWQEIIHARNLAAIRDVLAHHLAALTGSPDGWVLVQTAGRWESLAGNPGGVSGAEATASRVASAINRVAMPDGHVTDGCLTFPMISVDTLVGVLGLPGGSDTVSADRRLVLGAAAALLAASVRNAQLLDEVRERSLRDPLTHCVTRAYAMEVMGTELLRARRSKQPATLIMFDLDHFKTVNDRYGHLCGDAVLAALGGRIHSMLRGGDIKCRYGGEEFLVLLPDTPLDAALQVAESMRRELAASPIRWNGDSITVTGSFGVAEARPGDLDVQGLVARADVALYDAKRAGRNLVRAAA